MGEKDRNNKTSIRTMVTATTGAVFLIMFALLYAVYYMSMQKLLVERENDNMYNQAQLAASVLQSSVNYLPSVTRDWSSWDFTYDFVVGEYDEFLDDYLTEYPFQLFRLNFIAVLSADGQIVYEDFYDFWEAEYMESAPDLHKLYERVNPATIGSFEDGKELDLSNTTQIGQPGFINDDGQAYYFSSYPIIHSDETGPCVGSFIFGRIIDEKEIAYLTEDSGLAFTVLPVEGLKLSPEEQAALTKDSALVTIRGDRVVAYTLVRDLFGEESLVVSYESPRTLYNQGNSFISLVLLVIALCCLGVLWIILYQLNRIVIKPLGSLVGEVNGINMESISTVLEGDQKNEELDNLTTAINAMLIRIKNARDVIEKSNERLYLHANFDTLTGLRNRFSTVERLEEEIEAAKENLGRVSVFFFDLDRFKFINDTLGHSAGDLFIEYLAERLQKSFGAESILSRMGGDEFVIITGGLGDAAAHQLFAERIFEVFAHPFVIKHRSLLVSVSVGSSIYPQDGQDAETLIKNAEIAMFRAKDLGKGLYIPYKHEMQAAMQQRSYIENKLRTAVSEGCREFVAFFQPKVSIATGEIVGCEALMRWATPQGIVPPMEFIPQAEETGLILPLSWWMIRECCGIGKRFEELGIGCTISINVSAQVLLHADFLPVLQAAVRQAGIRMNKLEIEILEATLVADMEKVNVVLNTLHDLGAEISVDDFGTGYSSLSYLNKMAVDRIKIDRSFVSRLEHSPEDQAIVNAIIAMAKSLRMVVIAEGVEEQVQYDFLREAQCQEVQGYLISRPLPLDDFIRFYQSWSPGEQRSLKPAEGLVSGPVS